MLTDRRSFIKQASVGALGAVVSIKNVARAADMYTASISPLDEKAARLRELALNRATDLGADYADIRFTYTQKLMVAAPVAMDPREYFAVGIRILVNGYWGFASSSVWIEEQMLGLVDLAFDQAKGNSQGPARHVDIQSFNSNIESGSWIMPVKYDPFERSPYEYFDMVNGTWDFLVRLEGTENYTIKVDFNKQMKWYGSTNGSRQYQETYLSQGDFKFIKNGELVYIETLSPAGLGYELFTDQDIYGMLRRGYDEALSRQGLRNVPVDVGRWPVVVNAIGVAGLVGGTLGTAAELDRVLGFEANAFGTSYINDPEVEVGSYKMAAPEVQITHNRNERGGAATRKWDDEGVPVTSGTFVKDGILNTVFTDRETSGYITDKSITTPGSASAPDASYPAMINSSNLVLEPRKGGKTWYELVESMDRGIALKYSGFGADWQLSSGVINGLQAYEVRNGKITGRIYKLGGLFRTSELWSKIGEIGGEASSLRLGFKATKGEPRRDSYFSVTAPAMIFDEVAIIDSTRK